MDSLNKDNKFYKLGIDFPLLNSLNEMRINSPTSVQENVIPAAKDGHNIIVESRTGSGKTLAFLLPLIQGIFEGSFNRALIIAPTRELVLQIKGVCDELLRGYDISAVEVYGGRSVDAQASRLSEASIVVATTGRLLDHINRGSFNLSEIDFLVIDEMDNILNMGFIRDVEDILRNANNIKQVMLCTATLDKAAKKSAYRIADSYEIISENSQKAPSIEEIFIDTSDRGKYESLFSYLDEKNPFMAIIFCRTKARSDKLEGEMKGRKYSCAKIHSDISQAKRERILRDFRNLKYQYLIATDVASRGLDIDGITHIINFDFPENPEDYIHRMGRTARMGKEGVAVSFVTPGDRDCVDAVAELRK